LITGTTDQVLDPDDAMSGIGTKRTSRLHSVMSAFDPKQTSALRQIGSPAGSACHFLNIIVIRHETTTAARWASACDQMQKLSARKFHG
jgi:hypothetical protein